MTGETEDSITKQVQREVEPDSRRALVRFKMLSSQLEQAEGRANLEWIANWARLGIECGASLTVEQQLRRWLPRLRPPFARAVVLRLLGTALWRQKLLPQAVSMFRDGLAAHLDVEPDTMTPTAQRIAYDHQLALPLLSTALRSLDTAGIQAFPTAGSLLGLMREGRLLQHDKDLDIGVEMKQFEAADRALRDSGWLRRATGHDFVNTASYSDPRSHIELDLLGFAAEPGTGWIVSGFWLKDVPPEWNRVTEFPAPFALRKMNSAAGNIWVPGDTEAWLSALYGDWRTPDRFFDTTISAHNLRGFSHLTQCYAYSRILIRCLSGDYARALALTTQVQQRHTPADSLLVAVRARLESYASGS